MLKLGKNSVGLIIAPMLSLAACSQGEQASAPAPVAPTSGYEAIAFGPATISNESGVITATRSGEGTQGVSITSEPVLIAFTVEGPGSRVRVRQGGDWVNVPEAAQYAIMIGRGSAASINAYSQSGSTVIVRVLSVTPCSQAQCSPIGSAPTAGPSN